MQCFSHIGINKAIRSYCQSWDSRINSRSLVSTFRPTFRLPEVFNSRNLNVCLLANSCLRSAPAYFPVAQFAKCVDSISELHLSRNAKMKSWRCAECIPLTFYPIDFKDLRSVNT